MPTLNAKQRKILLIGFAVFILAGLFPPWVYTFDAKTVKSENPAGYGLLFIGVKPKASNVASGVKLDMNRLFVEWVLIIGCTVSGCYFYRDNRQ